MLFMKDKVNIMLLLMCIKAFFNFQLIQLAGYQCHGQSKLVMEYYTAPSVHPLSQSINPNIINNLNMHNI